MKLRLTLKTKTKKGKEIVLKFPIAPSKHIGFINFINLALNQGNEISLAFEKISKTGEREDSKIEGTFQFVPKKDAEKQLKELGAEIHESADKHQKQLQKRKQK